MPTNILYPDFRAQNATTSWPFSSQASLTNGVITIPNGLFTDIALYPIGGQAPMYLSQATLTRDTCTLYFGTTINPQLCSGSFNLLNPPTLIRLTDIDGIPAGVIVADPKQLAIAQSWGLGDNVFLPAQTELIANVCFPVPEAGVHALTVAGALATADDVWLVGDAGVQLTVEQDAVPQRDGTTKVFNTIVFNAVGDPLYRRKQCEPTDLFQAPTPIQSIRFRASNGEFVCHPDANGEVALIFGDRLAGSPILRLTYVNGALQFEAVGSASGGT